MRIKYNFLILFLPFNDQGQHLDLSCHVGLLRDKKDVLLVAMEMRNDPKTKGFMIIQSENYIHAVDVKV